VVLLVEAPPPVATLPAVLQAVASAASVSVYSVLLAGANAGAGNSTLVQMKIAAGKVAQAHEICKRLESTNINLALPLSEQPVCRVVSCGLDLIPLGTWNEMLTAVVSAAALVVFICTIGGSLLYNRHNGGENEMLNATKQLRHRLKIEKTDGYIVDSDWIYPWQNIANLMHLHKSCIESATKLSLLRDFNPLEFDAFCICLIRPSQQLAGKSIQHIALYDWILEICKCLLKPNIKADKCTIYLETGREWTERERFAYLKKICQCQVC
jgi:hypothetical protein